MLCAVCVIYCLSCVVVYPLLLGVCRFWCCSLCVLAVVCCMLCVVWRWLSIIVCCLSEVIYSSSVYCLVVSFAMICDVRWLLFVVCVYLFVVSVCCVLFVVGCCVLVVGG